MREKMRGRRTDDDDNSDSEVQSVNESVQMSVAERRRRRQREKEPEIDLLSMMLPSASSSRSRPTTSARTGTRRRLATEDKEDEQMTVLPLNTSKPDSVTVADDVVVESSVPDIDMQYEDEETAPEASVAPIPAPDTANEKRKLFTAEDDDGPLYAVEYTSAILRSSSPALSSSAYNSQNSQNPPSSLATASESVHWKPEWTGRPNFKRFRRVRQGGAASVRSMREVSVYSTADEETGRRFVSLKEYKPNDYGLGDAYWFVPRDGGSSAATKKKPTSRIASGKENRDAANETTEDPLAFSMPPETIGSLRAAEEVVVEEEEADEESSNTASGGSGVAARRVREDDGVPSSVAEVSSAQGPSEKRRRAAAAAVVPAATPPTTSQSQRSRLNKSAIIRKFSDSESDDDDDDGLRLRF
ncbi:hypothetical protein BZA70DRAFT_292790 [Myxozyma melibiosi]|uniref:Uncharacterized protein n=1 Tax=Myxozyma melibiosi TaxID=54550 RepID=A0ABR1FC54_9ASCO